MPRRLLGSEGECIVRSHIGWRGERMPMSEGGCIVRSHVGWRGERMPMRTLGSKGGGL